MRKGGLQLDSSRCRLLTLLLILLLGFLGANVASAKSFNFIGTNGTLIIPPGGLSYQRRLRIFSPCNSGYVREYLKQRRGGRKKRLRVDAKGEFRDKGVIFTFESHVSGGSKIYIRTERKKYVCFNRRGKLIVKHNRKEDCLFREIYVSSTHRRLQFVRNEEWYIGFSKSGRCLKGYATKFPRFRRCSNLQIIGIERKYKNKRKPFSPLDMLPEKTLRLSLRNK